MTAYRPIHEAIFTSQTEEGSGAISALGGAIPAALRGTFLRSGPGVLTMGEDHLNFFDGHALIAGVTFEDGAARFRSRHVRSPLYTAETKAGRMLKRRVFTNRPSRWANLFALELGNGAMHDVYAWRGKVFAGSDPGHFALDGRTLETVGPETWAGLAMKDRLMGPMPYVDPATGHLIGWIVQVGKTSPDAIAFVELDASGAVAVKTPFHRLTDSPTIVHDQRATGRFYVATEQAARLAKGAAIWGARTLYECFATPPGATATILLVPRGREGALVRVPLPAPYETAFHVINAFDDGDGRVVVDLCVYDGRVGFLAAAPRALRERLGIEATQGPLPTPMRFVVDVASAKVVEHRRLGEGPGEAPEVSDAVMGAPYRFAYFPTPSPGADLPDRGSYVLYDGLSKVDVESGATQTWFAEGDAVVSTPVFAARPGGEGEDDGWLLAYVMREAETEVVVLDARDLAAGPIATLGLGVRLPGVSHARFAPDILLDP